MSEFQEITDIDGWSIEVLQEALIHEPEPERMYDFMCSLGEVAARQIGVNLEPLEEI